MNNPTKTELWKKEQRKEKLSETKNNLKPILQAIFGAIILLNTALIIWIVANFDVFSKAVRYPEAIRELQIEIKIISPTANN